MRNAIRVPFDGSQARGNAKQTPYEMPFCKPFRVKPGAECREGRKLGEKAQMLALGRRGLVSPFMIMRTDRRRGQ